MTKDVGPLFHLIGATNQKTLITESRIPFVHFTTILLERLFPCLARYSGLTVTVALYPFVGIFTRCSTVGKLVRGFKHHIKAGITI
jgi:hypothetical protein